MVCSLALRSTIPPAAFPLGRSHQAPASAAVGVADVPTAGQHTGCTSGNGQVRPSRSMPPAHGPMKRLNQYMQIPHPPQSIVPLACAEEPPQRLESYGAAALSDSELLALVLQAGLRIEESLALARTLIAEAGSIAALSAWQAGDFRRVPGVGRGKAHLLVAINKIARRIMMGPSQVAPVMDCAEAIACHMTPIAHALEVENLCLDRKGRLRKLCEVSSGTMSSTLVHPCEVFRTAIREALQASSASTTTPAGIQVPAPKTSGSHVLCGRLLRLSTSASSTI